MQPRVMSVVNRQGVKDTRLEGEVAPEFSTHIVFPPYRVAAPHFYKIDKLVVLYVGENERVINVLEELVGPQIAGR